MADIASRSAGVPDLDWVERATHLFRDNGPYLAAVLFAAIAIGLILTKDQLAKRIAIASFGCAIVFAAVGTYVWLAADTNRLNPNVRYFLRYEVRDVNDVIGTIDRVYVQSELTEPVEGFASRRPGAIDLIIVSKEPIGYRRLEAIQLFFRDFDLPTVLCTSHLSSHDQLELVKDGDITYSSHTPNPFIFKSLVQSTLWKPVSCSP